MFQTNLPSGRRRLLIVLIVLIAIVVFGMRYLLVSFGWVGEQTEVSSQTESQFKQQTQLSTEEPETSISKAELNAAKQMAESFIKRYTQHDFSQSEAWLKSFQADLHSAFAEEMQLEAEHSRPTMLVQQVNFQALKRSACDPVAEKVHCHLEVTTETIDGQGQATLNDKGYEVILIKENGNWKVEGLNIHGSLD